MQNHTRVGWDHDKQFVQVDDNGGRLRVKIEDLNSLICLINVLIVQYIMNLLFTSHMKSNHLLKD